MNYIIHTPSATRLKKEIFDNVSDIDLWQCTETDAGDHVLVYTADQWAKKGCIVFSHNKSHDKLQVRFHYWDSCKDRNNFDDKMMLGRFTELVLVHFSYFIDKIVIE